MTADVTRADTGRVATMADPRLERRLDRDGYVVVPGLLDGDLADLRAAIEDIVTDADATVPGDASAQGRGNWGADIGPVWEEAMAPGLQFTASVNDDAGHRERLEEVLAPFWDRLVPDLFAGHEVLMSAALAKYPGPDGVMPIHQDPTFVDEHHARAVTLWIALDDVGVGQGGGVDNGMLRVLPGSHRAGSEWRGTGTYQSYGDELPQLWSRAVRLPMRAGDGVVLDGRVLHGSPPNRSDRLRLAASAVIVPRDTGLVHVRVDGEGAPVRILEADVVFYRGWRPAHAAFEAPPELPVLATMPNDRQVTITDVLHGAWRRRVTATARHHLGRAGDRWPALGPVIAPML